jgi:ATP-dependent DNA helicase RecG
MMTATPIPRTLAALARGDWDLSEIRTMPPGRLPVWTYIKSITQLGEVIDWARGVIAAGGQIFWVCALIEPNDTIAAMSLAMREETLRAHFGDDLAIIHGQLPSKEKDETMERFRAGEVSMLLCSTVIEVGVDVPEATALVVENAERFGLSQLHQLRGRVGRGTAQSYCCLLHGADLKDPGPIARLTAMGCVQDGFRLSVLDAQLRGEGDAIGTRQAGMPHFFAFQPQIHEGLVEPAREWAADIIAQDPDLSDHPELQWLIRFFSRGDEDRREEADDEE